MKKFTSTQTYNSYFINTEGTWKVCKKPKRKPNYVSYKRDYIRVRPSDDPHTCLGDKQKYYKHHFIDDYDRLRVYYEDKKLGISSRYWYGEDNKGRYVIRESDHWGGVGACFWTRTKDLKNKKMLCSKIYL